MSLKLQIPEPMEPFLRPKRHKIARGGRGSGKSWSIARLLILRAYQHKTRILCVREIQKSIKQSSHRLIKDQIEAMGLAGFFTVTQTGIVGLNGSEFAFAGLQDHTADTLKSYEGFDVCWVEEAHSVTANSANVLVPTIRAPGSEIWWSYNPDQGEDYIHKQAEQPGADTIVVTINWDQNPWFPAELDSERLKMKAFNDDLYQHIWEGKCRSAAGLIFKRRWFRRYKLGEHALPLSMYMSTDYAGAPDPDEPDREPDFNEFGVAGLGQTGALWFVDWFSAQDDADGWIPPMLGLIKKHEPRAMFEEKGAILRSIDGAISRAMQRAKIYAYRHPIASATSKADRALGFAAYASTNDVWVPDCDWGDRLINQLCAFTGQDGKTDDMVDVCSLLGRGIKEMQDAMPPTVDKRPQIIPFTRAHIEGMDRENRWLDEQKSRYYR